MPIPPNMRARGNSTQATWRRFGRGGGRSWAFLLCCAILALLSMQGEASMGGLPCLTVPEQRPKQFPDISGIFRMFVPLASAQMQMQLAKPLPQSQRADIDTPSSSDAAYTPMSASEVKKRVQEAKAPWGAPVLATEQGICVWKRAVAGSKWEEVKGSAVLACKPHSVVSLFETDGVELIRSFNPLYDTGYDIQVGGGTVFLLRGIQHPEVPVYPKIVRAQARAMTDAIEGLLVSCEGLLKQSREFQTAADSTSQVSMEFQVEKMVHCSESLLETISSLRVSGIANNVPSLNKRIDARSKEIEHAHNERQQALVLLGMEVSDLLRELEQSYYATPPPS